MFLKMNSQQTFALMLLTITLCYGHEQKYCGRSLARAIALICYPGGTENMLKKRSEGTMYNAILSPYYKEQESSYPWTWPPHKARALSLPSRGKRPVVSECCDKACSVSELLSYCD